jgi:hypothetical protein
MKWRVIKNPDMAMNTSTAKPGVMNRRSWMPDRATQWVRNTHAAQMPRAASMVLN